jgi:hypothetical protein
MFTRCVSVGACTPWAFSKSERLLLFWILTDNTWCCHSAKFFLLRFISHFFKALGK